MTDVLEMLLCGWNFDADSVCFDAVLVCVPAGLPANRADQEHELIGFERIKATPS